MHGWRAIFHTSLRFVQRLLHQSRFPKNDVRAGQLQDWARTALDASGEIVISVGADWRVTFMNRKAIAFARDRDLTGQVFKTAVSGIETPSLSDACERCMTTRVPTEAETPMSLATSHGMQPVPRASARIVPADDGGIIVLIRETFEGRDDRAEAQLRELLATVDLGAFMARDMDGTIRHWSAGCERLYGWTAAEAVGRISHDLLSTRFPVPLAEVEAELRRHGVWVGDLEHRARDGQKLVVEARKLLRHDAQGHERVLELVTDVTSQRQTEAALKESETTLKKSEATLSAVLDALPVGVIIADAAGRIARDNPANRAIWGIPPETGNWEQYGEWVGFWPETGARIQAHEWAMARALLHGEVVRDELVECQPFGATERRSYLNNAAPILDATGNIVGAVVAEVDVTERRAAEEMLADSEARLRLATDNARVGLVVVGEDFRYRFANRAYADILNLQSADIVGQRVADVLAPVYQDQIKPRLDQAFGGERVSYELLFPGPPGQGNTIYAVTYEPGRNEAGERIVVVVITDITERVRATQALAESEAKLRTIVELVPVGLVMAELPSGRIVSGNSYAETLLRHPVLPSPDINSYDEWVSFHADGSRVRGTEYPLARMVLEGEENPSVEVHYQRGDGTRSWTRIMGRPVRDVSGKLVGGVMALLDVDAERRARKALEELNRQLEDRVLEEVAAREVAQKSARHAQHMQAVGQLAGGVAHEFNNLLQAIQGSASLIDSRIAEPAAVRKFARLILSSSERGGTITSRLLSFAQRARFETERIEPAAFLGGLAEMLGRTLGANIGVRVEHRPGVPAIVVDKVQLETALVNLATNARDAMPQGGILRLSAEADTIADRRIGGLRAGRYLRLIVSDDGTGMDAGTLARATEPFFTTKPPGSGTGLGLSMVKGFAEQSGGLLSIESQAGRGTTVTLWLPAAESVAEAWTAPSNAARMRAQGHRVLLVDDEDIIREVLTVALEDAGIAVAAVSGGDQALALLRSGVAFDAMVCDFSMPGMDGVAVIREARQLQPRLPAVLLTGYAPTDGRLLAAGLQPGAFPVLTKPVTPAQLIAEVEGLLAIA
jgi:PAS domain S-box-containing protein